MKTTLFRIAAVPHMLLGALAAWSLPARSDAITDWNQRSVPLIGEARLGTPPAGRVMALEQTAAHEAAREAARAEHGHPPAAFAQAVALARIVAGVHVRHATEVGLAKGRRIGEVYAVRQAAGARDD